MKFDEIFSEEAKDYIFFKEKLRDLKKNGLSTKMILFLIYQYFEKYVTYNYDQVQIIKLLKHEKNTQEYNCAREYNRINSRIKDINEILEIFSPISPDEIEKTIKMIIDNGLVNNPLYGRDEAIKLLDAIFMDTEGRNLTDKNIEKIFSNYGERIIKPHENVKILGLNAENYEPKYCNGMLRDGVSSEYEKFLRKICNDLLINYMKIKGVETIKHEKNDGAETTEHPKSEAVETIEHSWSLIYLLEEQRWVHFDMAMVKFYQDGWVKNHEPYNMADWVAASTRDIFKMQNLRKITEINGIKCCFDKDNYKELDISKFEKEEVRE